MNRPHLKRLAAVNPSTREFDQLTEEELVTFTPLECVWADRRAEFSRRRRKADVESGFTRYRSGDVLLPKVTPTFQAGRVAVADVQTRAAAGTTELHILRARSGVEARYVAYLCRSEAFLQEGVAAFQGVAGLQRVPDNFVATYRVPIVDPAEQRRVADYLDAVCARTDHLVALRREQVAMLEERRRVLIDAALQGVRESSEVLPLRALYRPSAERGRPSLPVLSVYRDHGVVLKTSRTDNYNKTPDDLDRFLEARPGDVVVNKMKAWQGSIAVSWHLGLVSPDYEVLRPTSDALLPLFAHYVLRAPEMVAQYGAWSTGIRPAQWRLYWDALRRLTVPVPSRDRQEELAAELTAADEWTNQLLKAVGEQIALLHERRQALITAAVNGEFDVTTAGAVA